MYIVKIITWSRTENSGEAPSWSDWLTGYHGELKKLGGCRLCFASVECSVLNRLPPSNDCDYEDRMEWVVILVHGR